jgi:hypothetical protein
MNTKRLVTSKLGPAARRVKCWFVLALGFAVIAPRAHSAQQVVGEYDWGRMAAEGRLLGGTVITNNGRSMLKVVNTNATPAHLRTLVISQPPLAKTVYGLTGEVKCDDVKGDGYLEMWSCFAPVKSGEAEARYFSRTLGTAGQAMGKLTGTMDWRTFWLPFDRTGAGGPPIRLEFNLTLPGPGTVYLGPLKLVETTESAARLVASPNSWWDDRTAGLIGGIGGASLGCFAALLSWLASIGKARGFVLASMKLLVAFGAVLAIGAIMAIAGRQPYAVWFPLALCAALLLGIIPARFRQSRRHYDELELRRMSSMDTFPG